MTVAIKTVTTGDPTPSVAPHRISGVATHNQAVVVFKVAGPGPVFGYHVKAGGTARTNGIDVGRLGAVCGLDVCGAGTFSVVLNRTPRAGIARTAFDYPQRTSLSAPQSVSTSRVGRARCGFSYTQAPLTQGTMFTSVDGVRAGEGRCGVVRSQAAVLSVPTFTENIGRTEFGGATDGAYQINLYALQNWAWN
jgi:hypothetical protein